MSHNLRIACYLSTQDGWRRKLLSSIDQLGDAQVEWSFYVEGEKIKNEWSNKFLFKLLLLYHYWIFVASASRLKADLIVTHNPMHSFWCSVFSMALGLRAKQIAYSFNFHDLPSGLKKRMQTWIFRRIDRFVVHSNLEKELYSKEFNIPQSKIDVQLWPMDVPKVFPNEPLRAGDYLCAIGANARDYPTLLNTMKELPEIPSILVVRPWNLEGLTLPSNVEALVSLDEEQTMNILKYSRFMVLPLTSKGERCGHITFVAAMHLSKAFITTPAQGIADYVVHDFNAVTCEPASSEVLKEAIWMLWNDPNQCELLGRNGKNFAQENCSFEVGRKGWETILSKTLFD